MIKFKCDFCDQRLGVPDDFIGKRVRCTKCRAVNIVPTNEERIAKDAVRTATVLPAAMKATLPAAPPPVKPDKMALQSSLLDLSSASGSFIGELPPATEEEALEAKIFDSKVPLPVFGGGHGGPGAALEHEELSLDDLNDVSPDDSVVGLADTGSGMTPPDMSQPPPEEELSFDLDPPKKVAPPPNDLKAGHAAGKPGAKPAPPTAQPGVKPGTSPGAKPSKPAPAEDDGFGLDLLESDTTDSTGGSGKLDLDGLGF